MQTFEQIAQWVTQKYTVTVLEPYLLCLELSLNHAQRHQSVFLSELIDEDESKILRISTAVAEMKKLDLTALLAFNWQSRSGFLALGQMAEAPYLHLCENRPYQNLTLTEIERIILRIGGLGDQMERRLQSGDAL